MSQGRTKLDIPMCSPALFDQNVFCSGRVQLVTLQKKTIVPSVIVTFSSLCLDTKKRLVFVVFAKYIYFAITMHFC